MRLSFRVRYDIGAVLIKTKTCIRSDAGFFMSKNDRYEYSNN